MDLVNNQRFVITKVGAIRITIQDDSGMKRDIFNHEFQKYFLVSFCTTIHSSQGMSIGENYTIHEWDRLDQKLKYVALSRARDHELIHIMK
jgi:ATP-dependent exoDNAse (exonuclease V) alpha subunit